ncbi:hypothetical protein, partial [Aerococcus mictus]|uniref:hypothetical protein n=1 Tax=Aerococcus mictus TaxID=2976810 RepID=UPI001C656FAB
RDHLREWHEPVNVVLGSSMAFNNVETDILQAREHRPFVNLGAGAMGADDSSKLLSQFERERPVRDVIFVTQFLELTPSWVARFSLPDKEFHAYVAQNSWLVDLEHRDFWRSLSLRLRWKKDYLNTRRYDALVLSRTGAAPIDIGSDMERRRLAETYTSDCDNCMVGFSAFCKSAVAAGHSFS